MTSKTESKAAWGLLAQLPNMDAILSACQALEAEEEAVNRESVAERSGVRYTNQLAAGIKLYRERREWTDRYELPPALAHLVLQALEKAFSDLTAGFDQRVEKAVSEHQQVAKALDQDLVAALERNSQLKESLAEKDQRIEQLVEEGSELTRALAEGEQRHRELDNKYHASMEHARHLTKQLDDERHRADLASTEHQATLAKLSTDHRDALDALREQQEKERARLMQQLDESRVALRELKKEREDEAQKLQEALEGKMNQLAALSRQNEAVSREMRLKSDALEEAKSDQRRFEADKLAFNQQLNQLEAKMASLQAQLEAAQRHHQQEMLRMERLVSVLAQKDRNK